MLISSRRVPIIRDDALFVANEKAKDIDFRSFFSWTNDTLLLKLGRSDAQWYKEAKRYLELNGKLGDYHRAQLAALIARRSVGRSKASEELRKRILKHI